MNKQPIELVQELKSTELFKVGKGGFLYLTETNFYTHYSLYHRKMVWRQLNKRGISSSTTLEYVLENLPQDLLIQFLYHLDLFL